MPFPSPICRTRRLFLALALLFWFFGCATTASLSKDGLKTREVIGVVESLKKAYEGKELNALAALFSWKDPSEEKEFRDQVEEDWKGTKEIRLNTTIDRILFEKDRVSVSFFWEATWKKETPEGAGQGHGDVVLLLSDTEPTRVVRFTGDPPWLSQHTR
jgi:hypothetical protein